MGAAINNELSLAVVKKTTHKHSLARVNAS